MITSKYIRNLTKPRTTVEEYISMLKDSKPNMSVVDVGGGINSWCTHTTHVVDIFVDPGSKEEFVSLHPDRVMFDFDITQRENWSEILKYVEENGKFDYSICTHTLEDISNPSLVCEMLPKIAKRGFISVPSKYAEYLRFETWYGIKGYRGFFHHKWIYSLKDNVFTEIGFMWEDNFEYKFYHCGEVIGCHTTPVYPLIFETDDLPID